MQNEASKLTGQAVQEDAIDSSVRPCVPSQPSPKLAKKLSERRTQWVWDLRLVAITLAVIGILLVGGIASFLYHSTTVADTFRLRAEEALEAGDYKSQLKWLHRYTVFQPHNIEAIIGLGVAADEAVAQVDRSSRYKAINTARKQLSLSIARLGQFDEVDGEIADLRSRLIERLLQLGGNWCREAEQQVILAGAEPLDPQALKWLAMALYGQTIDGGFQKRRPKADTASVDSWTRLAHRPVGEVLAEAIDRNPGDIELIAPYLMAYTEQPDLFGQSPESTAEHQGRIDSIVSDLLLKEDSRSRLVLHAFVENRERSLVPAAQQSLADANDMLLSVAPEAAERLATLTLEAQKQTSNEGVPEFVWDYLLLKRSAEIASKETPEQAARWFDLLMKDPPDLVDGRVVESVFTLAGYLQVAQGRGDKAIEIWERGLKDINSQSLQLLGVLAVVRTQRPDDGLAVEMIDRFEEAIDAAKMQLAVRTPGDRAARSARGREISIANWRSGIVRGLQAARNNDDQTAISLLTGGMSVPLEVPIQERINAGLELAKVATRSGALDIAAVALDQLVELESDNEFILMRAAENWQRAGNQSLADRYWRVLGKSKSLACQIVSTDALFQSQLRLLPGERDFSAIRSSVAKIDRELDPASASADQPVVDATLPWIKRLDVLKVLLPPKGVSIEEYFKSADMAKGIKEVADKYLDDAAIQGIAAKHLANSGRLGEANAIVDRLENRGSADASAIAILRGGIESVAGDPLAASRRLVNQAERDPSAAYELLQRAALAASRAGDNEFAYAALLKIPDDELRLPDMFKLARSARLLPSNSQVLAAAGGNSTGSELSKYWQERIQKVEGENGTYAKWLQVTAIIEQLYRDVERVERNDPRLAQARRLLNQILVIRPRWGDAISLEGLLLAIEKRHEQAIVQLQRGIAAGDVQMHTQTELLRQFVLAGREEEAEQQILRMTFLSGRSVDEYGETRISLAEKRGDINRALEIARDGVNERPGDYLTHLVLARTATTAALRMEFDDRQASIDEAKEALSKAAQLAENDKLAIFVARIRLAAAESNYDTVKTLRREIADSELDEYSKAVLESQCSIVLKEYQSAEASLRQADQLRPTSQSQLALANFYRKTGQADKEIQSLRTAQRRAPEDATLRAELARSLATRDSKNVNWEEIETLLGSDTSANSYNRLLHAMILGNKGDQTQRRESRAILRELIDENNDRSEDAAKVLAAMLSKQIAESADSVAAVDRKRWISEARSLYQTLAVRPSVVANDLIRQADFLLSLDEAEDLPQVGRILRRLTTMGNVGAEGLAIAVRYAKRKGEEATIPDVVADWVEQRSLIGGRSEESISVIAGRSLIRHGFVDLGLERFEKTYQKQPKEMLATYVVTLTRLNRLEESVSVCLRHYEEFNDVESVAMLAEVLMNRDAAPNGREEIVIEEAIRKYGDNVQLLESVATLRMVREDYLSAISLFREILKIDPFRIRTLNNLAMACSEIPSQAAEGIDSINRAIKLAGEVPELLDTKGTVLLKAGRLEEALAVFGEAFSRSNEPRHQLHVVLTLVEQNKVGEARRAWQKIDLENLNPSGLTATERRKLDQFKREFATESTL
jgi:hypothetical protein